MQPTRDRTDSPSRLSPDDLPGVWVEFWALSGRADTQRYLFASDGNFEWRAAPNASERGLTRSWGTWRLQPGAIVLEVSGQEHSSGCEGASPCTRMAAQPMMERLSIGACPPDREAQAVDAAYHCMSINGRAFWRRAGQ